jgi:hypothetical protein
LRNGFICLLAVACVCVCSGVTAAAQSSDSPAGGTNPANSRLNAAGWDRVTQLSPGTRLKITAMKNGGYCVLQSVSADGLVCLHGSTTHSVIRTDIKNIRLARRGRSAAVGLAIGLGAGAGVGAGIGSAINSSDSGSFLHVSGGKSAAVGAGIGAIIGGATGGLVGYATDLFSGAVLYKRQP